MTAVRDAGMKTVESWFFLRSVKSMRLGLMFLTVMSCSSSSGVRLKYCTLVLILGGVAMVKHAAEDVDCEDAPEDPGAARLEEAIAVRRADAAPRQIQQKSEKANKRGPPRRGGARRRRNQRKTLT